MLEYALVHRALPPWAHEDAVTSFDALVLRSLETDPGRAALLIRRSGRERRVLAWLVRELVEASLARLLHAIEPESAALILAYLSDLRAIDRAEQLVALGEEDFRRVLWISTLSVLPDPGTPLNRRSFVRSLLADVAASRSIGLGDLLAKLRLGLAKLEGRKPLASSLPAVLRDLVD